MVYSRWLVANSVSSEIFVQISFSVQKIDRANKSIYKSCKFGMDDTNTLHSRRAIVFVGHVWELYLLRTLLAVSDVPPRSLVLLHRDNTCIKERAVNDRVYTKLRVTLQSATSSQRFGRYVAPD
jgi:hypothetical protein